MHQTRRMISTSIMCVLLAGALTLASWDPSDDVSTVAGALAAPIPSNHLETSQQVTCTPRPQVSVTTSQAGTDRLQVVVKSNIVGISLPNFLTGIRFGEPRTALNAIVDVPDGPLGITTSLFLSLPPGTRQTTFYVRTSATAQATTLPFTVIDGCGSWPTFVGIGPNRLALSTPTPTPTAIPTSTPAILPPNAIPFLTSPFVGEFPFGNVFDHNVPREFIDNNGIVIASWGESLSRFAYGIDGHAGHDWGLPEGTPIFAAAPGTITFAGADTPYFCPPLNAQVSGLTVNIDHSVQGITFRSSYGHFSRIDVAAGQQVQQGQQLGLSGNTGCSTAPHLHFQMFRSVSGKGFVTVDPYGWTGQGADPWEVNPLGAQSAYLWLPNAAPPIFRERRVAANLSGGTSPLAITDVRWIGADDASNPNNEWVEVAVDPRYSVTGTEYLSGATLRNNQGDTYTFPAGFSMTTASPVRVHSGIGQNTTTDLYWGRTSGVWSNAGDCAHLSYSGRNYYVSYGPNCT